MDHSPVDWWQLTSNHFLKVLGLNVFQMSYWHQKYKNWLLLHSEKKVISDLLFVSSVLKGNLVLCVCVLAALDLHDENALSSCGTQVSHCGGLFRCGTQALELGFSSSVPGPAALWHVESSQTRYQTHVPCIGRQILNHWTTREVQGNLVVRKKSLVYNYVCFWKIQQYGEAEHSVGVNEVVSFCSLKNQETKKMHECVSVWVLCRKQWCVFWLSVNNIACFWVRVPGMTLYKGNRGRAHLT